MRRALQGAGIYFNRIENIMVAGMPDVVTVKSGRVTFCELKAVEKIPARASTPLLSDKRGLSPEQRNWHLEWTRAGGNSLIIVGIGASDIFVVRGAQADAVNRMPACDLSDAAAAWSWDGLMYELERGRML